MITGGKDFTEMSESNSTHENDLPLMANIQDITVYHYILDLKCHMDSKVIEGSITIFCRPADATNVTAKNEDTPKSRLPEKAVDVKQSSFMNKQLSENLDTMPTPSDASINTFSDKCTTDVKNMEKGQHRQYSRLEFNLIESNIESNKKDMSSDKYNSESVRDSKFKHKLQVSDPEGHSDCKQFKYDSVDIDEHSASKSQDDKNIGGNLSVADKKFYMVLDCCSISIISVEELCYVNNDGCELEVNHSMLLNNIEDSKLMTEKLKPVNGDPEMAFILEENCVKISKHGCENVWQFPGVVRVKFQTQPEGLSLKWTLDQDSKPCMFTHGHWINNRSLFPSQDAPTAMATWQATVYVEEELTVVMSGDKNPTITREKDGWRLFHFHTTMLMPSSTLSLAVGHWKSVDLYQYDDESGQQQNNPGIIPCRLFVPDTLVQEAYKEFGQYLPLCLQSAYNILGPHPFKRLDVLVVPPCFDSLGMASPSVVYIAQSVLAGDFSMCVRLAHEVSHSWFGLAIGPEDWTEEWLTEGFATYLEDIIHHGVLQKLCGWTRGEIDDHREIRDYLRHRTLLAEVQHTKQELQTLRPNQCLDNDNDCEVSGVTYVKHGMNPEKRFMQVHYLKGYFLLHFLEDVVGLTKFSQFLRDFVQKFNGKLITSRDVFVHFFEFCPESSAKGVTETGLFNDWLNYPGIPQKIKEFHLRATNERAKSVLHQMEDTKKILQKIKRRKNKSVKNEDIAFLQQLESDQVVLFLELLLQEDRIPKSLLKELCKFYLLDTRNADIKHRWCELIIKHRLQTHYLNVKDFLLHHQAMGVYLFGELIITKDKAQRQLAEDLFKEISLHMEPDPYQTVKTMLYGE